MKKDITLLIMAAGMGSRFGGLKQIEPMGPSDEFLIDYSIYDAIKAGFTKVVFIIKEENIDIFKKTIGARIQNHIKVEYCFQKLENIGFDIELPKNRVKPLGTAHAIYTAKDIIKEPFAIINADDFYGADAFKIMAEFLKNKVKDNEYGVVGYEVDKTLSDNGSVKRAICFSNDGFIEKLEESSIEKNNNEIIATTLEDKREYKLNSDFPFSLNMFGFTPHIFKQIEDNFAHFFEENMNNLDKCEYLIPSLINELILNKEIKITLLKTVGTWYGVTYKEDTNGVKEAIKNYIDEGIYSYNLWN